MMERHRPSKCKWCQAEAWDRPDTEDQIFDCFTVYEVRNDQWRRDSVCVKRSANQVLELRDRIQRALEELKATERRYVSNGFAMYVDARDVEHAVKILEGSDAKTD